MRSPLARGARLGTLLWAAGCGGPGGVEMRFVLDTPHEQYRERLQDAGLRETALARDWIAAAERAVTSPLPVELPHRELRYLDPARAAAVGYRLRLERGQRLIARVEPSGTPTDARVFLDLFFAYDSTATPSLVHSADSLSRELDYVALRPGVYVLRVQPELLRGGRLTLTLSARASLSFPVAGRNLGAVRSAYGDPRDGGRRAHHGLDIFAPRGTPVLAATEGYIARTGRNRLGGNVVWLRDRKHGRSLYYAHLDSHAVRRGVWVAAGDTVGFVGNTGNARTTPPHLHFGIYVRGTGPVDPYFHLFEPPERAPVFAGTAALIGTRVRVAPRAIRVRSAPHRTAATIAQLPAHTPLDLIVGIAGWYGARLPDGREGYVAISTTEPLDSPLRVTTIAEGSTVRTAPGEAGITMDTMPGGLTVSVLGAFGAYVLVERDDGLQGWIASRALASVSGGVTSGR